MSNLLSSFNRFFKDVGRAVVVAYTIKKRMDQALYQTYYKVKSGLLILTLRALRSGVGTGLILSALGFTSFTAQANELCLPQWIAEPVEVGIEDRSGEIELDADLLTQSNSNLYEFTGSVEINQPGTAMFADKVLYQREQQKIDAFGQVELHNSDLIVLANEAHVDNLQHSTDLLNTQYQMKPSRSHGKAKHISVDQESNIATLKKATFTTCPIQTKIRQLTTQEGQTKTITKEKVAWELKFKELEINQQNRRVTGKHTTLKFHNVPIFYSPYFDFPLDDRASGLLFPNFGNYKSLTDSQSRFYYKQPYYFNLAPNYDDTLTAMPIDGRGLVLENEFRYLQKTEGLGDFGPITHRAALTLTGLKDSETAKNGLAYIDNGNVVYGEPIEQRWRAKLIADQAWSPNLTSSVLWHETSDENFFADIPVEEEYKSVTNIQRYAQANYRQGNWNSYIQFLNYLQLRDATPNYEKRPEIGTSYYQSFGDVDFDIVAETTQFAVSARNHTLPEAQRTRLAPSLSYGINRSYGYLKGNVTVNHLNYAMKNNANNTTGESSLDHTVMQYSLRGGLIFERDFNFAGQGYIQTLEPELQYLLVPYVNQSRVPLFDTSDKSLDFSNLFAYNRFSGFDRIGDTQQVTMALTSKILTQQGRPLFEAGIGQIRYLKDREVALYNNATTDSEQSDYFIKARLTAKKLYLSSTSQFSQEDRTLINANSRARWDYSSKGKVLLNHTVTDSNRPNEKETVALGAAVQLTENWQAGTYWSYDMTNKIRNEMTNALRYDDCCWAGELSLEKTQLVNGLYNYSVQFLIEFKGLSSAGRSFNDYLGSKLDF